MRIAIASGKGGTGKTTVATNLAVALARAGERPVYVDCDVEEPNGHIFLQPRIERSQPVRIDVPSVDLEKCDACGLCGELCQFSAILSLKGKALTFPEMCHACGGCARVCPRGAIREVPREIGYLEEGVAGGVRFVGGRLNIGEARSTPLIDEVKRDAGDDGVVLIDAPPGASCPAVSAVRGADLALLVAEPTPFGLHDLKIAVEMIGALGLPAAVVVNRAGLGDQGVDRFCRDAGIPVIQEIPDDRRVAEAYSRGELIVEVLPEFERLFIEIFERIRESVVVPG